MASFFDLFVIYYANQMKNFYQDEDENENEEIPDVPNDGTRNKILDPKTMDEKYTKTSL